MSGAGTACLNWDGSEDLEYRMLRNGEAAVAAEALARTFPIETGWAFVVSNEGLDYQEFAVVAKRNGHEFWLTREVHLSLFEAIAKAGAK